MHTMTRRTFAKAAGAGAMALGFGGVLAACAGGPGAQSAGDRAERDPFQVIVTMPTSSEPAAGFDPFVSWGCGEHVHEPLIQSTLVKTTVNMGFENDLATSYACSDDGLTWTFGVRGDVKFTSGAPLTAADVAYTLNGIKASAASECDLTMIETAEAPDARTVVIHMAKPFNALLYTLATIGIVPDGGHGEDYGSNPVGSGRYVLAQWDRGQQVIFEANPDYYGPAPKIERVVVLFMEEDASLAAAQAGQADVSYTSATFAAQQPSGYDLLNCTSVDSRGISLPVKPAGSGAKEDDQGATYEVGNDVTCDLAVRRAINYAADRQAMIDHVLSGFGEVAYNVGYNMPWSSPDMACDTDRDRARALLDEAGWAEDADGVRAKDGTRASFELYYAASDTVRQAIANEFADQMREVGIEVVPKGAGWDEIYAHEFSTPVVWGWGTNSPIEVYNLYYSTGVSNYASYESDAVDAHMNAALAAPRVEDSFDEWKLAMWDGADGVAPEGAATWVWFANVDHLYFVRDGLAVADQKPHPHGHGWSLVNNVDQWEWM